MLSQIIAHRTCAPPLPRHQIALAGAVVWWKTKELVGLRFDPREDNSDMQEWVWTSAAAT
jgi:hypothetical protein